MAVIATPPKLQFFDSNGNPLVGGKLYSYAAGTVTPLATFTDAGGGTPNTNPVILDSRGEASVWLGAFSYKFKLTTSTNVDIWTVDNVTSTDVLRVDLASTASGKGAALVGFIQSGTGAVARTAQEKLRDVVSVSDFISADPAVDANFASTTAAFENALATGKRVYVPAGTYVVENVSLPSGCELFGDGDASIVKQRASAATNNFVLEVNATASADTGYSTNAVGIRVHDLQLLGRVATEAFSEFVHLIHMSGVSEVFIERVFFKGFRGDGLYIGSTTNGSIERHNRGVTVRDCRFDGVNSDNRNAISVIDCDGLTVENCYFVNCTRSNMPGAIDVEPDSAIYHIIRNIRIVRNRIATCGGTNGGISFYFPDVAWTVQPGEFLIDGNEIDGGASYVDRGIYIRHLGNATTTRNHDIKIVNNTIRRCGRGLDIAGVRNALIRGNQFDDIAFGALFGFSDGVRKNLNLSIQGNTLNRLGFDNTSGGTGINVFDVDYLDIVDNTFIDAGKANGTFGCALDFNTGTSSYVNVSRNRILNPGSRTTIAFQKEAGHTFAASTNIFRGNRFGALANNFEAHDSDTLLTSYAPIVEGGATAGTGTYTAQFGRFQRDGDAVTVWFSISANAGHTGTGVVEISLPLPALSLSSTVTLCALSSEGVTTGNTLTGLLNTAAVANGVAGALRVYQNVSGGASATVGMPGGAFGFSGTFTYSAQPF
jgi:hypothetical protein